MCTTWSTLKNSKPNNWTPTHSGIRLPISSIESDEIKEPALKKSKLCIDSDDTPKFPRTCRMKGQISSDKEFRTSKHDKDGKSSDDNLYFYDLGKLMQVQ